MACCLYWQMLLTIVLWLLLLPLFFDLSCAKRCTTVIVVMLSLLADVVAKMAGGFAIVCVWQVLLPSGWCFCHCVYSSCWQMLLPGG